MLKIPIVDAHLHLWDTNLLNYPWLADIPLLDQPFIVEDMKKAFGPVMVENVVFLQCECEFSQYQKEADWVTKLAQTEPRIGGIVAWAPLERGGECQEGSGPFVNQPAD